jgi:valyl-tRNA synthetase
MPFVSEAIWKEFGTNTFVMVEKWPKVQGFFDEASEKQLVSLQELIIAIRNIRSQYKIEPKKLMDVEFVVNDASRTFIEANREIIAVLARVNADFVLVDKQETVTSDVSVVLKDLTVFIKMETVVDTEKEKVRIEKEVAELTRYLVSVSEKLANEEFRSKAPEKVIVQMEQKQKEAQEKLEKLSS